MIPDDKDTFYTVLFSRTDIQYENLFHSHYRQCKLIFYKFNYFDVPIIVCHNCVFMIYLVLYHKYLKNITCSTFSFLSKFYVFSVFF
jgi:hypothetical protein